MAGRTISIKVRFHDFRTITRSITLPSAVDTGPDVVRAASDLLRRIDPTPGVRLLGVHVSQLADGSARQLSLDDVERAVLGRRHRAPSTPSGPATAPAPSCRPPWPGPRRSGSRSGATSSGAPPDQRAAL